MDKEKKIDFSCIDGLEQNPPESFLKVSFIILKLIHNVLLFPGDQKFRKIRLENPTIKKYVLPAIGAMECLFEMGFQECQVFQSINTYLDIIKQYEDESLRNEGRNIVPLSKIMSDVESKIRSVQSSAIKSCNTDLNETSLQQILFLETLMMWFKNDFFKWMDNPKCTHCQSTSTVFLTRSRDPNDVAQFGGASVEIYQCQMCANRVYFPRYNDVSKLLRTRTGRCGEWAICFTFFCRVFGYDARLVLDWTDHLWTEVFVSPEQRWIHFDACEGALDSPLMYEIGWKKSISYIIAFSRDEVQDVTWRYTTNFASALQRRNSCSEEDLIMRISSVNDTLRSSFSQPRLKYLRNRHVRELTDFLSAPQPKAGEKFGGRLSGSLAWRISRGENYTHQPHVWTPTAEEIESKLMIISYDCVKDEYSRACGEKQFSTCISGWKRGLRSYDGIFRKEEMDWKKVYLCRTEESSVGSLVWEFNLDSCGLEFESVDIAFSAQTFSENASITLDASTPDEVIHSTPVSNMWHQTLPGVNGKTSLVVKVLLKGGEGDHAWQHAQVFRQSMDSSESTPPFCVTIKMKQKQ
ncbi:peptide-N(4)-(N-acetyl-beta-glucosaminyl)asparagine amidase isoform X2 [Nilaparvata lugens]|uniref:peptide-N(4)-(N-acetyl-beta- glucosaminyl)asparagine amidase isoform X2 n=1 Tax=Nilaparvata lugens TaxID=108931 RepID=UPI00193D8104|nr:peptide-N(4)-(N-acetyl-beta-glucosaminyl)asparagine amidase isoform X2 [Nilaparvata lugens]